MFTKVERPKAEIEIELDKLVPFGNQSFKLFQGRLLDEMIVQISLYDRVMDADGNIVSDNVVGIDIRFPIIIRPIGDGRYEILDGHYRVAAARKLKSKLKLDSVKIPAIVKTGLTDEEAISFVSEINPIGLLLKDEINILCDDYRQTEGFKRAANDLIRLDEYSLMAMDEYIEHFLLDEHNVYDLYESIYSMGNPYKLTEEECADKAVALEIMRIEGKEIEGVVEEFRFIRDGGYIQQLKKHLGVDLDSFGYSDIKNRRERAKVLFFIYALKKEFPTVNILQMLSKPSMENIDNSFLGWKTSNGEYIKFAKHEIEMEITPILKSNIKRDVSHIVNSWGDLATWFDKMNSFLFHAGCDCLESVNLMILFLGKRVGKGYRVW